MPVSFHPRYTYTDCVYSFTSRTLRNQPSLEFKSLVIFHSLQFATVPPSTQGAKGVELCR